MSKVTILKGIPLYTTKKEALAWALANGINGYHSHIHNGKKCYMGGATHSEATISNAIQIQQVSQPETIQPTQVDQQQRPVETPQATRPQPVTQPTRVTEPIRRTTPVRRTSSGRSGGGGY